MNEKHNAKLYMLAKSLRAMADADITGEAKLCPVAVQTLADELLTMSGEVMTVSLPHAA
ncbi:MAG TPA: hypothetical protein PLI96_11365 [Halothiobacillus sp.]|nr:hypothetical protein [Halothiobacillus sp.]